MRNNQDKEHTYRIEYEDNIIQYEKPIRSLTRSSDEDFVPPLHTRNHTLQTEKLDIQKAKEKEGIEQYADAMLEEEFLICKKVQGKQVVGFLAFIPCFEHHYLADYSPANYITTIIVDPTHRRKGLTRKMYQVMLNGLPQKLTMPYLATRTWTGKKANTAHINLLEKLYFKPVTVIEDHRGPGIDTVYFAREITREDL